MTSLLRVLRTGPLALLQDDGRPGQAAVGVGRSGAADRTAYALANRLVANPPGLAAIETTLGGLELEVRGAGVLVCLTGAPAPLHVDGVAVGDHAPIVVPSGSRLRVDPPVAGLRSYLAVRGGIDVPPVLGSRSHDVLSGLGPPPLAEGDLLRVGPAPREQPSVDQAPPPRYDEPAVLRVVRGPRADRVVDADALVDTTWTASDRSNRIGMRLTGGRVAPVAGAGELVSEGVWRGAVQVPPNGEPVVFLSDHPVTGGYPVVGVVLGADVDRAAQVRPGQQVRFRWVGAP